MVGSSDKQSSLDTILAGEDVSLDEDAGLPLLRASSFTCNRAGTRLLYGASDGELRCVDFYKWMSGGCGPLWTKKLEQSVSAVAMNHDDSVAAAANGTIVSFYSDAGEHIMNTTKGDMYLLDARKTRGHTATVTCVSADPLQNNLFTSGSIDGTIRTFDIEAPRQGVAMSIHSTSCYVPRSSRGPRAPIRSLGFATLKGTSIIIGGTDRGGILTWDRRTAYPGVSCLDAHMSPVNSVISHEEDLVLSRCNDNVKLWDLRNLKNALRECTISGGESGAGVALSPDGAHLAVGEVIPVNPKNIKEGFKGSIRILCTKSLDIVETLRLKSAPGPLSWAHELGQLLATCHDGKTWCRCSTDALEAMYLQRARETTRQKRISDTHKTVSVQPEVHPIDQLPDNLEETDDGTLKRRRVTKQYKKPGAREEPDLDYVSYGRTPVNYEDEDIVTKLRAMEGNATGVAAEATGTGIQRVPYKVDKFMRMYQKTQPELILDFTAPETKEENMLQGVQKCPRCGIKICQCGYMDSRK
ncbi:Gastrulation defective protein 1 [Babesia sp. Xinjiang]|uniref:Gastrulation defective protein 1 n=1 Tax=Babesia sp. Xinjiang TaxID=462227 RepID=UPI000A25DAEB|nr:Gastrulation defective protein 1 [Babesia sp. Xinjiang]ORM41528.1 Gastrulation defective protein 1 [Babesia sp. Xinjiang]